MRPPNAPPWAPAALVLPPLPILTPLLIFYGIPSEVAVATTASHLTASSMSGAIAQWRRKAVDFKMAGVMLAGGLVGSWLGVFLSGLLRAAGQSEIAVSAGDLRVWAWTAAGACALAATMLVTAASAWEAVPVR